MKKFYSATGFLFQKHSPRCRAGGASGFKEYEAKHRKFATRRMSQKRGFICRNHHRSARRGSSSPSCRSRDSWSGCWVEGGMATPVAAGAPWPRRPGHGGTTVLSRQTCCKVPKRSKLAVAKVLGWLGGRSDGYFRRHPTAAEAADLINLSFGGRVALPLV